MQPKSEKGPVKPSAKEEAKCLEYMRAIESDGLQTTLLDLKYYADEETRQEFARNSKIRLPEHEDAPFARDHLLPG